MALYRSFRSFRKKKLRPLRLNPSERRTIIFGVAITVVLTTLSPVVPRLLEARPVEPDAIEPAGPARRRSAPEAAPGRSASPSPGGMIAEHRRGGPMAATVQSSPAPRVPTSTRKFAGSGFTAPARPHHLPQAGSAVRCERPPKPASAVRARRRGVNAPPVDDADAETEPPPPSAVRADPGDVNVPPVDDADAETETPPRSTVRADSGDVSAPPLDDAGAETEPPPPFAVE